MSEKDVSNVAALPDEFFICGEQVSVEDDPHACGQQVNQLTDDDFLAACGQPASETLHEEDYLIV